MKFLLGYNMKLCIMKIVSVFSKTKFIPWNTNNTNRNGIDKKPLTKLKTQQKIKDQKLSKR